MVDDQNARYFITIAPWLQKYRLIGADTVGQDRLGYSVAVDGNVAVVGAPYESDLGTGTGAAFVYVSSGSWVTATESAKLVASEGTAGDQLGCSVTISQAARCN